MTRSRKKRTDPEYTKKRNMKVRMLNTFTSIDDFITNGAVPALKDEMKLYIINIILFMLHATKFRGCCRQMSITPLSESQAGNTHRVL
jgi:hypothetical protein